ncbi:MAG: NRDE family protein, partial [Stenotrophomonas sp.]|nr:NRDE family protein [Stenotrophomonas sp.]
MCLIAFAWNTHPDYVLALAANRDEFHGRPTAPLNWWADTPGLAGGRDLREGGGWLALHKSGRLAAVTNVREPHLAPAPHSRGELVRDFAVGHDRAADYAARVAAAGDAYGPHNLLLWDGRALVHASNRFSPPWRDIAAGVHGISNGPFDAPWPKTRRLAAALGEWLRAQRGGEPVLAPLLDALADEHGAEDPELPQTGVGLEMERLLAPPFIC